MADNTPHNAQTQPKQRLAPRTRRVLIYLLIGLFAYLAIGCGLQRTVLYPRHLASQFEAPPPPDAEVIHLDTDAGQVESWFLPAPDASPDQPAPAVIFAHGNGELIDLWPEQLRTYRDMGFSVYLPEYRGYGRSAGRPAYNAILSDFKNFHDILSDRPDVDEKRIIYHGRSLGGGVLGTLALHREPAAIILESSFTSIAAMARRYLIPAFMVRDPYNPLEGVRNFHGPVLILQGEHDRVIPPDHARQLHEAAPNSTLHYYDIDHNTPPPHDQYWADITAFLAESNLLDEAQAPAPEHD